MSANALLLSVRPEFACLIADGRKTAELRRTRPRVDIGAWVLIYETAPSKCVIALGRIERITSRPLDKLWREVRRAAAIPRDLFDNYYAGTDVGHAIFLRDVKRVSKPIPLAYIERVIPGFRPPQSFRYVSIVKLGLADLYHAP